MKTNDGLLHDDNKTKKELLNNIEIQKTNYQDVFQIIEILKNTFNIPSDYHVIEQLLFSNANLKESIKIVDKRDNKIYGLLILSYFNIDKGSPIKFFNNEKYNELKNLSQINGHSFVIDKRLRNTNLDKKMLNFNKNFIDKFDMIWCGVGKNLNSHSYWKRLGFNEIFEINDAIFYNKLKN